ncbi:MAG TPA: M48 family metalloprotease [Blastocatellia bacterium]|nr:M48 family metalloprotease [Blastocatellia bacterium]
MNAFEQRRFESGRIALSLAVAAAVCLAWVGCARTPPAPKDNQNSTAAQRENQQPSAPQVNTQDEELQIGQEVFNELKAKAEIVESSPLYDQLRPIADEITRVAQPRYNHPFKFYLVHEAQPNAFATPGGNVYVTDSLMYFVKNIDQLAGTLCHEVSHTIHHDTITLMKKREKLRKREVGAAVLLGPTRAHVLAIAFLGKLHSLGYSRDVEERADLTGSDICAATDRNPWGLVWLLQDFKNANTRQVPELLSDHPNDEHRVAALEQHFRQNPSVFAKFNPDPNSATSFSVPQDAAEVFLR